MNPNHARHPWPVARTLSHLGRSVTAECRSRSFAGHGCVLMRRCTRIRRGSIKCRDAATATGRTGPQDTFSSPSGLPGGHRRAQQRTLHGIPTFPTPSGKLLTSYPGERLQQCSAMCEVCFHYNQHEHCVACTPCVCSCCAWTSYCPCYKTDWRIHWQRAVSGAEHACVCEKGKVIARGGIHCSL